MRPQFPSDHNPQAPRPVGREGPPLDYVPVDLTQPSSIGGPAFLIEALMVTCVIAGLALGIVWWMS